MKPNKINSIDPVKDRFWTPTSAINPLLPYIRDCVWEPAAGSGRIVDYLIANGKNVISTDIYGQYAYIKDDGTSVYNFLTHDVREDGLDYDCIVTNPPYSKKHLFVQRCFDLQKPFALLVPVETIGAKRVQDYTKKYGLEIMLLNKRVWFDHDIKALTLHGPQFPVMWMCWQMLPEKIMYGEIN